MLRSYFAIALRQLAAQKLYSAINIAGLAVGLAAAMLVSLFVWHELSYDRFHANADRVFRVSRTFSPPGGEPIHDASMPPPVAPLLKADFEEIEEVTRLRPLSSNAVVVIGERTHVAGWLAAADSELFRIFDFDWLEGDDDAALGEPYSIVLTESMARRYFGERRALGETLLLDGRTQVEVTGVIRDLPDNTHLRFDMLVPMGYLSALNGNAALERWNDGAFHTYVLLQPGAGVARVQSMSRQFFERHMPDGLGPLNDFTAEPLVDIHLSELRFNEMKLKGSIDAVYVSGVIAALILAIACINFVNLATAAARRRAKEVGVRKTLGVTRGRLTAQFLGESLLLTAIAAMLALAAVELLLPIVSAFLEKDLELDYRSNPVALVSLVGITLLVGLTAGAFPALYISAFEPAKVLKGDVTRGRTAMLFRSLLVGAQFSISIALIIATAVVYRQIMFMGNVDLGYDKEQIVVVSGQRTGRVAERWEILKREWLAHPEIVAATGSSNAPGTMPGRDLVRGESSDLQSPPIDMHSVAVDFDFFSTYGIEVLAGRAFSRDVGADSRDADLAGPASAGEASGAIVNARAARAFGWTPEEAVGKTFSSVQLGALPSGPPRRIVGVIGDIHFLPLQAPIEPMMFTLPRSLFNVASIKIIGRDLDGTLAHIDAVWARIVPEQPISRRFLDDDFDAFYRGEQRQSQMLRYSSLLAVLLACLGLFGLASLTTEQRRKEIGIRKVLGGTIADIVRLFAGELGRLVLLANVIAWPVAYILMRRWLDNFAYRIELDLAVFVGSGFLVLAIAWSTVGAVAARAAAAKPVQSLRHE